MLQRDKHRAGRDILAYIDAANAEAPGEGRDDCLLRDNGARALGCGGGLVARRPRGVEIGLRRVAASDQLALALQRHLCVLQRGLIRFQIGLLGRIVDLDEGHALGDILR